MTVMFDVRDSQDRGGMFDMEGEGEGQEGEDEEEGTVMPFVVDMESGSKMLRFRCLASETVEIDAVEFLAKGEETVSVPTPTHDCVLSASSAAKNERF